MNLYTLALFLHVAGDIGIFIGLGVHLLCLAPLRRAQRVEQVRLIAGLIRTADIISTTGALLTITTGLYMALTAWNLRIGWIAVALGSIVVLIMPLIAGVIEPRTKAIVKMAGEAEAGPIPAALGRHIHDPVLAVGLQTGAAIVLGIVFLMTTKPALVGSITTMAVALALGLASGLPFWIKRRLTV
jgi:uncharacterized membrane protein